MSKRAPIPGGAKDWYEIFGSRGAPGPRERGYVDPFARVPYNVRTGIEHALTLYDDAELGPALWELLAATGWESDYPGEILDDEDRFFQEEDIPDLLGIPKAPPQEAMEILARAFEVRKETADEPVPEILLQAIVEDALRHSGLPRIVNVSKAEAVAFVAKHHSQFDQARVKGLLYAIGVVVGDRLGAVALANTPSAGYRTRACPQEGILDLSRIASDRSIPNASSMLASRVIDLLASSGRRGVKGCLFVTNSLLDEHGTTYLALADKGLRPVGLTRPKKKGTGARKGPSTGKPELAKVIWEAGPAALPPRWEVLAKTAAIPKQVEGAKAAFAAWEKREEKRRLYEARRAQRAANPVPRARLEREGYRELPDGVEISPEAYAQRWSDAFVIAERALGVAALQLLGCGDFGCAAATADGAVLKLTQDEREVALAHLCLEKRLKGFAKVYVAPVEILPGIGVREPLPVVAYLKERLEPAFAGNAGEVPPSFDVLRALERVGNAAGEVVFARSVPAIAAGRARHEAELARALDIAEEHPEALSLVRDLATLAQDGWYVWDLHIDNLGHRPGSPVLVALDASAGQAPDDVGDPRPIPGAWRRENPRRPAPLYMGAKHVFRVGRVLRGRAPDHGKGEHLDERLAHATEDAFEAARPAASLSRRTNVFMVEAPDEDLVERAGGSAKHLYEVEPVGSVERNDVGWWPVVFDAVTAGEPAEAARAASAYFAGKATPEPLWEYRAPALRIVRRLR